MVLYKGIDVYFKHDSLTDAVYRYWKDKLFVHIHGYGSGIDFGGISCNYGVYSLIYLVVEGIIQFLDPFFLEACGFV